MNNNLENNSTQLDKNIWFCVLNLTNFLIVKQECVYGIPKNSRALKQFEKIKEGDLLLFYAISPQKRIVGKANVISPMFLTTKKSPWKDRLYPYRVKISKMDTFVAMSRDFLGKVRFGARIPVGKSVFQLSNEDFEIIRSISKGQK